MVVHHLYDALHHDLDWHGAGHQHPQLSANHHLRKSVNNLLILQKGVSALSSAAASANRKQIAVRSCLVVVCGCLVIIPSELILKSDQQGMNLMTLSTYIFAICSSLFAGGFSIIADRKIPLSYHAALVLAGYGFNKLSNVAFGIGLPMPLALVVKNGSLLCQMAAGGLACGDRYNLRQLASALTVTLGIIITVQSNKPSSNTGQSMDLAVVLPSAILMAALMSRSLGNCVSQTAFKTYGKQYNEVLFYQHALGLPLLLWDWRGLLGQAARWNAIHAALHGIDMPILWLYLVIVMFLNVIVTRVCGELVAISNSVVVNLVLTIQRCVSIVISALFFNAPPYPPLSMWLGALLVVVGCMSYVLCPKCENTKKQ